MTTTQTCKQVTKQDVTMTMEDWMAVGVILVIIVLFGFLIYNGIKGSTEWVIRAWTIGTNGGVKDTCVVDVRGTFTPVGHFEGTPVVRYTRYEWWPLQCATGTLLVDNGEVAAHRGKIEARHAAAAALEAFKREHGK